MTTDDGRMRDVAVTNAENIATAWRTEHGPDVALPYNPGFAHCIPRWLSQGERGTALGLLHYAQREGWRDDEFLALERECLASGEGVK